MEIPVTSRGAWQAVPHLVTSPATQLVIIRRLLRPLVTSRTFRQAVTRQVRHRAIGLMVRGTVTSQMPQLGVVREAIQRVLPSRAVPSLDTGLRVSLAATHARTRHRCIRPMDKEPVIRGALMRRPTRLPTSRSTTGARASLPAIRRLTRAPPTRWAPIQIKAHVQRGPAGGHHCRIRPRGTGPVIQGVVSHPRTLVGVSSPRTQPRARRPAIRRETVGPPPANPIRRLPWSFLTTVGRSPTHPSPVPPKQRWKPEAAAAPGRGRVHEPAAS